MRSKKSLFFLAVKSLPVFLMILFFVSELCAGVSSGKEEQAKPFRGKWKEVQEARHCGILWLKNNFRSKGLWRYLYYPDRNEYPDKNNAIRQLMASRLVAELSHTDSTFLQYHRKNMDFIFKFWYRENRGVGYVQYNGKSKLGSNAMLLRTLVASPDYADYEEKAQKIFRGILQLQNEDGGFSAWYKAPSYEYDEEYLLNFYSGEAILGLLDYYSVSRDSLALAAAIHAQEFYYEKYINRLSANFYPAYVPWHSISLKKLFDITGDKKYLKGILLLNDELLKIFDSKDYPGRFYNPVYPQYGKPHASSDGVYTEGLAYAYLAAKQLKDKKRMKRYKSSLKLAVQNLISLQYRSELASLNGGLRVNIESSIIRVDNVQHAVDAFNVILKEL